ncbi:hypothetical protein ANN_23298 [Periplaneta americana]|uniref:Uncharacterized protein n=1 Tax=Periplaneta americana TaxID=6978 RepID=A0ABQ8SMR1_PERAM|nr:hypothetical protein ANN_23298 [Periplaneta americana]
MDYWRPSCQISRMGHIRDQDVRNIMQVSGDILQSVETKRLIWYGHLQRMSADRWPNKVFNWTPPEKREDEGQ